MNRVCVCRVRGRVVTAAVFWAKRARASQSDAAAMERRRSGMEKFVPGSLAQFVSRRLGVARKKEGSGKGGSRTGRCADTLLELEWESEWRWCLLTARDSLDPQPAASGGCHVERRVTSA